MRSTILVSLAILVLAFPLIAADSGNSSLPHVVILATGGTIAGTASSATELLYYTAGSLDIGQIIASVPGLQEAASLRGEQICNIDSDSMTQSIWLTLAHRANEVLADPKVSGLVITHGTDTLEETAYFLNLVVHSPKPVVVTGSMRPATALSADGPLNLLNAVQLAADPIASNKGVLVCLNGEINGARDSTKTMTQMVQTFRAPDFGLLGYMEGGKPVFYRTSTRRHTASSGFDVGALAQLPRVDIVYGYAGMDSAALDAFVLAGAHGIVLAGLGNAGYPSFLREALLKLASTGIPVVVSSRTGSGISIPDDAQLISADTLNPQKARVLLMLALTQTSDKKTIETMFGEY